MNAANENVPRWTVTEGGFEEESRNGDYVHYTDYAALTTKYEAERAAREADAADARRWRNHVESSGVSHSHKCRRCAWSYTPVVGTSEDCPACGFDGIFPDAAIEGAPK